MAVLNGGNIDLMEIIIDNLFPVLAAMMGKKYDGTPESYLVAQSLQTSRGLVEKLKFRISTENFIREQQKKQSKEKIMFIPDRDEQMQRDHEASQEEQETAQEESFLLKLKSKRPKCAQFCMIS